MKLFLVILFLTSALATANTKEALHHIIGCSIYDLKGKLVREFGGGVCLFLPDGSYIAGLFEEQQLYRVDKNQKILWRDNVQVHHQLNMDLTGRHFLLMTGSEQKFKGKWVRFDRLEIRDFANKSLHTFDFFKRRKELMKIAGKNGDDLWEIPTRFQRRAKFEFSHINSFYQIDDNVLAKTIPAFAKGNYIVNANGLRLIFILDAKLEKILWSIRQVSNHEGLAGYHDVQVTSEGRLLIYNNMAFAPNEASGFHSAVWSVDPVTQKRITLYEGTPLEAFASRILGGAQLLPTGNLLLSDITKGGRAFEVTSERKIVWQMMNPNVDPVSKRPLDIQQVKRLNVSEFLRLNREL